MCLLVACSRATPVELPPTFCEAQTASVAFRETLRDLNNISTVETWPGYRLDGHDIVFEWLGDESHCFAHWSRGEVVTVAEHTQPMQLMLGIFGFLITDFGDKAPEDRMGGFLVGDVPASILASLHARDAKAALAWVMNPEHMLADHPLGAAMADNPRLWRNFLIAHESVHVNLQFARMFGEDTRHDYPSWSIQPDREALVATCFENEVARALHDEEMATNASAVREIFAGNVDEARAHARRFIQLRRERYAVLGGAKVRGQHGTNHTCEEAEAIWELDEGLADYVAVRALIEGGVAEPEWFIERISARDSQDASFYYSGSGQLVFLWQVNALESAASAILVSERPEDGIFGQFERTLSRADATTN
ncbi:MAG: hypothetical protein AB8H86_18865 [Polyangiales bacterium]